MEQIKTILFWIGFLGLIILACSHLVLRARFVYALKKRHPEWWNILGSPTLFLGNNPKQCLKFNAFIMKEKYLDSEDTTIQNQGRVLRVFNRVYLAYFLIFASVFVLTLFLQ